MWSDMSFTAPMKRKSRHLFFFGVRYERLVFGGKPTDETVVSSENKAVEQWRCSTH